jgi:hypothetical protein
MGDHLIPGQFVVKEGASQQFSKKGDRYLNLPTGAELYHRIEEPVRLFPEPAG